MDMRRVAAVLIVAPCWWCVLGLDNGLGRTPAMGYNTWNDLRCEGVTAQHIMEVADAFLRQDLPKHGYEYVNIDGCWAVSRNRDGEIQPNQTAFPNGMKVVGDYLHERHLKFGIYTDRGTLTCGQNPPPGSLHHETQDAKSYASWGETAVCYDPQFGHGLTPGVDFLKEDSCHATGNHTEAFAEYATMRDALNATGRPIYFSLCGWFPWYAPVGASLGNSWRISGDVNGWDTVLRALDDNAPLSSYAGPGGWNDPDMLVGSDPTCAVYNTPAQSRSQFSLWCIMAAPLLIGSNVRNLTKWDLETFTNDEMIAIDQDSLGKQGIRLQTSSSSQVWVRELSDGSWAVAFLNTDSSERTISCDASCFHAMHMTHAKVRDLWEHAEVGTASGSFQAKVEGGGASRVFKFTPTALLKT